MESTRFRPDLVLIYPSKGKIQSLTSTGKTLKTDDLEFHCFVTGIVLVQAGQLSKLLVVSLWVFFTRR